MPTLLACGAVKTVVEHLDWQGPAPSIAWGTVGALRDRILEGERPAATVLSEAALDQLAERGIVDRTRILRLGRSATGLAIRDGAIRRNIDTADGFREALLAAERVGWADASSGATAGRHFESVIERLGIAEAVRARATLFRFGVEAVAACGRGEVELAVSQTTEILERPGVALLGLFPPPFDLATGYAAAPLDDSAEARRILDRLTARSTRTAFQRIGFTPA